VRNQSQTARRNIAGSEVMREIVTEVMLPFVRGQVWAVLTDFRAYAEWNPLNVAAVGVPVSGARVRMTFIDPGHPGRTITQDVRIIDATAPSRLEWVGTVPLLFRGQHYFELRGNGSSTNLRHGERLSGLIPNLWGAHRIEQQRLAYEAMNEALAIRLNHLFGDRGDS
jgi:hypothetical protein